MGKKDDPKLMQEWFKLVQEKNALVRYESELMILWVIHCCLKFAVWMFFKSVEHSIFGMLLLFF